ncbi:hypothetical protein [Streptomyces virginiae]|uniref:hypothetical protein n=1 Tax=Streptomyces virginiae TaxID=1961 RepID=UPI00225C111F|nr:hypothetical protein [Streptomyces virginiae]MCX4717802.1 hypothetical protein [Streptomyces virginiae]
MDRHSRRAADDAENGAAETTDFLHFGVTVHNRGRRRPCPAARSGAHSRSNSMILILGLILLIAAIIVGLAGVFGNTGPGHDLGVGGDFSIFGYHVTGSTGSLFLSGIIVGAVALLGLTLVMMGARRSVRRSAQARRELDTSRREAAVVDRERDDLIKQRDDAHAGAGAGAPTTDMPRAETDAPVTDAPRGRGHWFGHRAAHR